MTPVPEFPKSLGVYEEFPPSFQMSLAKKIINVEQYLKLAATTKTVALDSTWFMPNVTRDAYVEYLTARLPKSRFFDIDKIKDESSPYPHMIPSVPVFNKYMSQLGLTTDDTLVVYDTTGIFSSPRALWMLTAFGHDKSFILDSYPKYLQQGLPIEVKDQPDPWTQTDYKSSGLRASLVKSFEDVHEIVTEKPDSAQIIDARPGPRFTGEAPEPRPGLSSGHVPGAISIPFVDVLTEDKLSFKSPDQLKKLFEENKVDTTKPLVIMCGTGVTACVVETALNSAEITKQPISVYDGSWTEWGQRAEPDLIVKDV